GIINMNFAAVEIARERVADIADDHRNAVTSREEGLDPIGAVLVVFGAVHQVLCSYKRPEWRVRVKDTEISGGRSTPLGSLAADTGNQRYQSGGERKKSAGLGHYGGRGEGGVPRGNDVQTSQR